MEEKTTGSLVIALNKNTHVMLDGKIKIEMPDSAFDENHPKRGPSEVRIRITAPLDTKIKRVKNK